MPRRVRQPATRASTELHPAVLEFFLDGDYRKASFAFVAANLQLSPWAHARLAAIWKEHRADIFAEAKRRRIKGGPYATHYDRCRADGNFEDGPTGPPYRAATDDPRIALGMIAAEPERAPRGRGRG
jgi:hypothetical protein